MKKSLKMIAAALTCTMIFSGCGGGNNTPKESEATPATEEAGNTADSPDSADNSSDETTEKPDLTGSSVIVYNTSKEEEMAIFFERFEEEYGIAGETVRLSAGEALGRITVERENPKANVWYGGGIDSYIAAKEEGLLEPYFPENTKDIPDKYKDSEGYFTGQYLTYLVIAYNEALLNERGVEAPTTWQDLLKPEFEGQITMANPGSSGTAYTFLSTMCQLYGEEEGLQFMKQMHPNVKSYEKSGSAPSRLVAQGEAMIAITYFHDVASYQEQGFTDLNCVIPSEGTGYEIGCVGLIKDGPDQDAAKEFINFVLRPENQVVSDAVSYYCGHTNPEAETSEQIAALGEIKLIDYDFEWSGSNKNRLIEEWSALVGE